MKSSLAPWVTLFLMCAFIYFRAVFIIAVIAVVVVFIYSYISVNKDKE